MNASVRSLYSLRDRQQQRTRWTFGCTRFALQQQKRAHKRHSKPGWPARSTSLPELAGFISGVCFDQQCQQAADRAFFIVTSIPLLGLLCAIILKYRPPSAEALSKDEVSLAFLLKLFVVLAEAVCRHLDVPGPALSLYIDFCTVKI